MKSEYRIYGRDSESLLANLTPRDRELLDGYLAFCATTAGPRKIKDYRRYMLQFRDVLEKPYDSVSRTDAVMFWGLINHAQHEHQTKMTIRRTVKRFLKWHFRDLQMIEPLKNPRGPLVNPKKINKSVLFSHDEIEHMLRAAERVRDKAILAVLAETGARPQEIRDAKWGDINWDAKEIHLYSTKTTRDRDLPIIKAHDYLRYWFEHWVYDDPTPNDYIFPALARARQPRNKPISTSFMNRIVQRLAQKVGIQRRVHTYLLRHSRLTEVYRLGVKGIEHNKFAGHVPGSKHQNVYVHLDNRDLKESLIAHVYGGGGQPERAEPSSASQEPMMQMMAQMQAMYQKQVMMLQQQLLQMQQQLQAPPTVNAQNASDPNFTPLKLPGVLPGVLPGAGVLPGDIG